MLHGKRIMVVMPAHHAAKQSKRPGVDCHLRLWIVIWAAHPYSLPEQSPLEPDHWQLTVGGREVGTF